MINQKKLIAHENQDINTKKDKILVIEKMIDKLTNEF